MIVIFTDAALRSLALSGDESLSAALSATQRPRLLPTQQLMHMRGINKAARQYFSDKQVATGTILMRMSYLMQRKCSLKTKKNKRTLEGLYPNLLACIYPARLARLTVTDARLAIPWIRCDHIMIQLEQTYNNVIEKSQCRCEKSSMFSVSLVLSAVYLYHGDVCCGQGCGEKASLSSLACSLFPLPTVRPPRSGGGTMGENGKGRVGILL